jgi:hypothetical protein
MIQCTEVLLGSPVQRFISIVSHGAMSYVGILGEA